VRCLGVIGAVSVQRRWGGQGVVTRWPLTPLRLIGPFANNPTQSKLGCSNKDACSRCRAPCSSRSRYALLPTLLTKPNCPPTQPTYFVTAAAPRDMFAPSQPRGQYKFKALVMQLQVGGGAHGAT